MFVVTLGNDTVISSAGGVTLDFRGCSADMYGVVTH